MGINTSAQFSSDWETAIGDKLLPLSKKHLCVYGLGQKVTMEKGRGTSFIFMRYNRIGLPAYPLSEGSPNASQALSISEVTGTVQQWGILITLTDRATYAVKHDTIKIARERLQIALAELLDRNTFNTWAGFSQLNTVNSRVSIGSIAAGDILTTFDVERTNAILSSMGAYMFDGSDEVNPAETPQTPERVSKLAQPHFIVIVHPNVASDLRQDRNFVQAASFSDVNKLYNREVGQWAGHRVLSTNMCPYWTGIAAIQGTAGVAGNLATGTYFIQVTSSDPTWKFEQNIYQVSNSISVTGPNGSISVTLPASPFLFNVYIGTTNAPVNLAAVSNPIGAQTLGPAAGMAALLPGGQTIVLTGLGIAQVPPPAPATGVTVYMSFVLGRHAFCQLELMPPEVHYLGEADKIDPMNQQRMVSCKIDYATTLVNNMWMVKIASASGFGTTFS